MTCSRSVRSSTSSSGSTCLAPWSPRGGSLLPGTAVSDAESFQPFVDAFAQAFPESLNLLILDDSGAHTAQRLTLPANVRLVFLPPYCPALNPIERVWRDRKDALA